MCADCWRSQQNKHKTAKSVWNLCPQPMLLTLMCCFFLVQFNPLLRDIFGLGAPLILDATVKSNKISRFEKVMQHLMSLNLNLHAGTIWPFQYFSPCLAFMLSSLSNCYKCHKNLKKKVILCDCLMWRSSLYLFFLQQHLFNSAAFKARTKQRNKVRDKRADVMWEKDKRMERMDE